MIVARLHAPYVFLQGTRPYFLFGEFLPKSSHTAQPHLPSPNWFHASGFKSSWASGRMIAAQRVTEGQNRLRLSPTRKTNHIRSTLRSKTRDKKLILTVCSKLMKSSGGACGPPRSCPERQTHGQRRSSSPSPRSARGLRHGIMGCRMSALTRRSEGNERCLNKAG